MAVDDEVTVRRLLVLTHTGLDQRSITKGREAERNIFANVFQRLRIDHALAIRGIEIRPARVIGDLESTAIAARNPITEIATMIPPDGNVGIMKARIAGGSAEEEDVLL